MAAMVGPRDVITGPVRVAMKASSRLMNYHADPSEARLRRAVGGRTVLITGASYGIGEASAQKLAAAGGRVVLVARTKDRLDEVAQTITSAGGVAHVYPADLSDVDAVRDLAEQVLAEVGPVDILVNNAGKSIRRSIHLSYDRLHDFQRTTDLNYLGPVQLVLALLPAMRKQRRGHIVNISTWGVVLPPAPRWAAYQASKAAFDVWLRSVAIEAGTDGVKATSVYFSVVRTRMSAPTPVYRYVPSLSPEQAAGVVAQAIVTRPRSIGPWWLGAAHIGAQVAAGPVDAAQRLVFRLTRDSDSAAGQVGAVDHPR